MNEVIDCLRTDLSNRNLKEAKQNCHYAGHEDMIDRKIAASILTYVLDRSRSLALLLARFTPRKYYVVYKLGGDRR